MPTADRELPYGAHLGGQWPWSAWPGWVGDIFPRDQGRLRVSSPVSGPGRQEVRSGHSQPPSLWLELVGRPVLWAPPMGKGLLPLGTAPIKVSSKAALLSYTLGTMPALPGGS